MNSDFVMKALAIIGTVLIAGLFLKDANQFNTIASGVNSTLKTLEAAG